jgi:RNA polymerase subunit RPABC4/transcription elongation factor Spt4
MLDAEAMTSQKACQHCHQLLPADAQFCPRCGVTIGNDAPRACARCGKPNLGTARFCQQCGAALTGQTGPPADAENGQRAPQSTPAWGQLALGGLGGLLLGSLFGGPRGFGGFGDGDDFGGGDFGGADFGGGGDSDGGS